MIGGPLERVMEDLGDYRVKADVMCLRNLESDRHKLALRLQEVQALEAYTQKRRAEFGMYQLCYRPLDPGTSPPRSTGISVMRTTRWSWMTRSSGKIGLVLFVYASPDVDGLHESPCDSALMYVTRSPVSSCSVPCAPYPVPCTL
jgi:hypothetical protein